MEGADYRLSAELEGHFDAVRHIEALPGGIFASSSRDCTVRIWKLVDNKEWGLLNLLNPHKQLADRLGVASTHYIPAGVPGYPNSAIVTCAYDHKAVVQHPETSEVYQTLQGHSAAVTCATHAQNGDIITGSADFSLIVWRNGVIHKRLQGHQSIVWAVVTLPTGIVVSAAADKTIRFWDPDSFTCVNTVTTNYTLRTLWVIPDIGILSGGNENSLQLYSFDGQLLNDLVGSKDTVFGASSLETGSAVTSSEDSVTIWNGSQPSESLAVPSRAWSVAVLDNGDIVCGCQDRKIRVFTRDPTRFMSDEMLAAYMEGVFAAAAEAAENAQPKRQTVNGVEYDEVIQVDLAEGQPTIPLGFNFNEAPVDAAERFINQQNISPMYLDQITQFISNAMGERKFAAQQGAATAPYVDPFRDTVVPSQFGTNQASSARAGQPQSAPKSATAPKSDPFPIVAPILVETGSPAPVVTKFKQLNDQLKQESDPAAVSDEKVAAIESLANKITSNPIGSQNAHFTTAEISSLLDSISALPSDKRFPLLDLARLAVLYPDFANQTREKIVPLAVRDLEATSSAPLSQLMALRVLLNSSKWSVLKIALSSNAETILEHLAALICSTANANIPSLAVSLLRNFATLLCEGKSEARIQILSLAHEEILLGESIKPELLHLGLFAIGTIISRDAQLILMAQEMGIPDVVAIHASSDNEHVRDASKALQSLFSHGVPK